MRFLILPFFIVSLLIHLVALGIDIRIALLHDVWKLQLMGDFIVMLGLRQQLGLVQAFVERYFWPDIWWSVLEPILHQPATLVTLLLTLFLGMWFYLGLRRHKSRQIELVSSIY